MEIRFGREVCGDLQQAEQREWLVTNGIGGFACGTIAGSLTRRYHGLLVAALKPPLGRTLLLAKLDETVQLDGQAIALHTNRWASGAIAPTGHHYLEEFLLEGQIPVWRYAIAEALLEKRIWMKPGENTTYIYYQLKRGSRPLTLTVTALVNYRDYHHCTRARDWRMTVVPLEHGVCVAAYPEATQFRIVSDHASVKPCHNWHYGFDLPVERSRGLDAIDDHLHVATFETMLLPGESVAFAASTNPKPKLDLDLALRLQRDYEQKLLDRWRSTRSVASRNLDDPLARLVLAADQFIVRRPSTRDPQGVTILAGYPWFTDWGRDTMISLPGLTLCTGRPEMARSILRTYAHYVSAQGMLPNRFPDEGQVPEYNTVDATLWFFETLRTYYTVTDDEDLLHELFPVLATIIAEHCRGTAFNIHLDPADGLLYAGEPGTQLTWMDAKVGDWVVTPRIGKPIEVNALWYNALRTIARFARQLGKPHQEYEAIADRIQARFSHFWHEGLGYCYDVLDGPDGHDTSLRPNQLLAVSLTESPLTAAQQKAIVDVCEQELVTSHGLRSLAATDPHYQGHYGGSPQTRDAAYHQGTIWGWWLGPFVTAHLRVYHDPKRAREFLRPMMYHLTNAGLGNLSEIFDGDPPFRPRGCFAQAWTVAEVLRAWHAIEH